MTNALGPDDDGSAPPGPGIFGLHHDADAAGVVLLAVPWEATTSYGRGTAAAPAAIVRASAQVELFDPGLGRPDRAGIALLPTDDELVRLAAEASAHALPVIAAFDAGMAAEQLGEALARDLARVNELSGWLDRSVERDVTAHARGGKLVGVLGGDHSVAYGSIAAQARLHAGLGVLQIDAHADLRPAYQGFVGSHASVMHRVALLPEVACLVSVGVRDLCEGEHRAIAASAGRIRAFLDADLSAETLAGASFVGLAERIAAALPEAVYVSFDVDGLDPSLCPHTGTPVPGGLAFAEIVALLAAVVRSGRRIVGFDLCEVVPGPPGRPWDENVGARLLYQLIGQALATGPRR
jgi:agmatinase